jgi:hypothetical protein
MKFQNIIGTVSAAAVALLGATSYGNAGVVGVAVYNTQYDDTGSGMEVSGSPDYTSSFNSGNAGFYFDWNSINTSINNYGTYTAGNVFTAYFTGTISAPSAGNYNITIGSDDASYLFINGGSSPVISDGGAHGYNTVTESVSLTAGSNSFQIQYGNVYCCGAATSLSVSGVPEPSTWAMMVLGFAGLGYAGYRKTKSGTAVFASA